MCVTTGSSLPVRGSFHYVCHEQAIWFVPKSKITNCKSRPGFQTTIPFTPVSLCNSRLQKHFCFFSFFALFFFSNTKLQTWFLWLKWRIRKNIIVGRFNQTVCLTTSFFHPFWFACVVMSSAHTNGVDRIFYPTT